MKTKTINIYNINELDEKALEKAALIAAAPEMLHALELVYSNAADHPDKIRAIIDEALDKVRTHGRALQDLRASLSIQSMTR